MRHRRGYSLLKRPLIQCAACGYQASVTAGTIFHRSRTPLRKWFAALYFTANEKRGISALRLSSMIGVTYKTAWLMLHKIRRAMAERDGRYQLIDLIKMDDAFFGGENRGQGLVGRGTRQTQVLVAVSVFVTERGYPMPVYGRMTVVPDFTRETVNAVALRTVAPGSMILTDGGAGFNQLGEIGSRHDVRANAHPEDDEEPSVLVHTFISNAKAWILGTFHGLGDRYKQAYLDEYCYRFSRRHRPELLFERLLRACTEFAPLTRLAIMAR